MSHPQDLSEQVRRPRVWEAGLTLSCVLGLLMVGIRAQAGISGVFVPLALSVGVIGLLAFLLGHSWAAIQQSLIDGIGSVMGAGLIVLLIGMIIGIWALAGTLPTLVYYGLQIISPTYFLPSAFLVCVVMSLAVGTSMGTIATAGVVLMGVQTALGLPAPITAGAILSGALFGDKMSPLSDSTILAAAMGRVDLFRHIRSMMYTTVPAAVLTLLLFGFAGRGLGSGKKVDLTEVLGALDQGWRIHPMHLTPMLLMLILALRRVPALLLLFAGVCFSGLWALLFHHASLNDVLASATSGFSSRTGVAAVDSVMSRGGIVAMEPVILILVIAGALAGVIQIAGLFDVIARTFISRVKKTSSLIVAVLLSSYAVVILTGNNPLNLVLVGRMYQPIFAQRRIDGSVATRSLEDAGTLGSSLVPWSPMAAVTVSMLGVPVHEYLPYAWLTFLVPVFSVLCAVTGIGVWTVDEDES